MASRELVVQKYGGMSLATAEHIRAAAHRVAKMRADDLNIIVVVSAMGATTDGLIKLAYSVSSKPNRRELDMLLSTGERISMALFSMALTDALLELCPEAKAISFTGSQAGILTDETHANARIVDVKSIRVQEELTRGNVVILAGFQGVSPRTKEITTLGRGGTDVTAVALAAAFKATRCEILKEVPGVLSADPKLVPNARSLRHLTHAQLLEMTFWGAKVLHYRSVELASTHDVPITVALAHPTSSLETDQITLVQSPPKNSQRQEGTSMSNFENGIVLAVTSHADVRRCYVSAKTIQSGLASVRDILARQTLPTPQIIDVAFDGSKLDVLFCASDEVLEAQVASLKTSGTILFDNHRLATVTVTCQGSYMTDLLNRLLDRLEAKEIQPVKILCGALSITFVIDANHRADAVLVLHEGAI